MGLLTGRESVGYNDSTKYDFAEEKMKKGRGF